MAFELISKVLTQYKADVSDHVRGLEKLKGEQRKLAEETIKANKESLGAIEDQIKGINRMRDAFAVAKGMINFAADSLKLYTEHARLSAASGGADIEKLRKASGGLKTDTQLLADAARLQAGAFKLTEAQMVTVERAMRSFNQRGIEAEKVNQALTMAVTALKTDGLKDLGVFIDTAGLSMERTGDRGEIFRRIMERLHEETKNVNDSQQTAAERAAATGVSFKNAMDKVKIALGEIAVAMTPVIEKAATLVDLVARFLKDDGKDTQDPLNMSAGIRRFGILYDEYGLEMFGADRERGRNAASIGQGTGLPNITFMNAQLEKIEKIKAEVAKGNMGGASNLGVHGLPVDAQVSLGEAEVSKYTAAAEEGIRAKLSDEQLRMLAQARARAILGVAIQTEASSVGVALKGPRDLNSIGASTASGWGTLASDYSRLPGHGIDLSEYTKFNSQGANERYDAFNRGRSKSKLESMFGPIEDFNLYAKGFQMLQGAVSSAMTAWIDGSMSAGKAIKAFIGEAIKSLSIQMAMEALKHGAFAIGSLAFGDFRGAATHGKAAAAFAAGAAISAVAAKGLAGGGGGVPGVGGGAGAAAPVGGAGGFGGGPQYQATREVIFVNDTFGMNSNRQAVQQFKRRSEEAYGAPGTKNS